MLEAARLLFGQKGFERTTVREIGGLAGIDAALIARYFGGKADLYMAVVATERLGDREQREFECLEQIADAMVADSDENGLGPSIQALIRSDTLPEIRVAAQSRIAHRLVDPVVRDMTQRGADRPRLRAELSVSALIGITLARSLGWFDEIELVPHQELVDLLSETIAALAEGSLGEARPS